jgi:hypothetical protein
MPNTWPMVNRIVPHSSPGGHGLPLPWAFASHTTLVLGQVPAQDTCAGRHLPAPRTVGMPRAFNPAAIACRLLAPLSCSCLMAGMMSAARASARRFTAAMPCAVQLAEKALLRLPPSFLPRASATGSASSMRGCQLRPGHRARLFRAMARAKEASAYLLADTFGGNSVRDSPHRSGCNCCRSNRAAA